MANLPVKAGDPTQEVVKAIARDIGKEVAAHIETTYPKAVEATTPNMLRSVYGCVYNEIMAALEVTDEGEIIARLKGREKFRRRQKKFYKAIRADHPEGDA